MQGRQARHALMGTRRTRARASSHGDGVNASAPGDLAAPRYQENGAARDYGVRTEYGDPPQVYAYAPENATSYSYAMPPGGMPPPPTGYGAPDALQYEGLRPPPPIFLPQVGLQPPGPPTPGQPFPMASSMPAMFPLQPPPPFAPDGPRLRVRVLRGEKIDGSSPFVVLTYTHRGQRTVGPQTRVLPKRSHRRGFPVWEEVVEFALPNVAPEGSDVLSLEVWAAKSAVVNDFRGSCHLPMEGLNVDIPVEITLPLFTFKGRLIVEVTANFEPQPRVRNLHECVLEAARDARECAKGRSRVPDGFGDDAREPRVRRRGKVTAGEVGEVLLIGGIAVLQIVGAILS
jgi:hypothetical protein